MIMYYKDKPRYIDTNDPKLYLYNDSKYDIGFLVYSTETTQTPDVPDRLEYLFMQIPELYQYLVKHKPEFLL